MDTPCAVEAAIYDLYEVFGGLMTSILLFRKIMVFTPTPVISPLYLRYTIRAEPVVFGPTVFVITDRTITPPQMAVLKNYNSPACWPAELKCHQPNSKRANEIIAAVVKQVRRIPLQERCNQIKGETRNDFAHA